MNRFSLSKVNLLFGCIVALVISSARAKANTVTFHFAPVGTSFSAFLAPDNPLVGKEIRSARIFLDIEANSDAANFFTDIVFPIAPFPGNENGLFLTGGDLGWSGTGIFHFFEETKRFNGIFVAARYAGETPGENFSGALLETSRIEFNYVPELGGTILLFVIGTVPLVALHGRLVRERETRALAS
jgi:hypothetical protein